MLSGPFSCRQIRLMCPEWAREGFSSSVWLLPCASPRRYQSFLDNTGIHPERYELIEHYGPRHGCGDGAPGALTLNLFSKIELDRYATRKVGMPTLSDIILELQKPRTCVPTSSTLHADTAPRISRRRQPPYRYGALRRVTNLTASEPLSTSDLPYNGPILRVAARRLYHTPAEVVRVGQNVRVRIIDIDPPRNRAALLSMRGVPQLMIPS